MSVSIKKLINDRQRAFHSGDVLQWRRLKYKVQTEIAVRKKEYYRTKVQHLKKDDCRKWWQVENKLSGRSQKCTKHTFEKDGVLLSDLELANNLNKFYISVNADIPPLDITTLPAYLPAVGQVPYIEPHEVCEKLLVVNSSKTCGPDNIPGRLLKEFSLNQLRKSSICHFHPGLSQIFGKTHTLLPFQKLNNQLTRLTQDPFH